MRLTVAALTGIALLAMTSASDALTWRVKDVDGAMWDLTMPPTKYNRMVYAGSISVVYVDQAKLREICAGANASETLACSSLYSADYCMIWMAKGLPKNTEKLVRVHEEAHCNGWPGDHPTD